MNDWLRRCPVWQFVLAWDAVAVLGVLLGGILVQWLWRHHLDLSVLAGSAVGCALASTIVAIWYRHYHRPGGREVRPP